MRTSSTGTPWSSSTSAAAASIAAARLASVAAGSGIEPGAQLALLPACERGDAARVAGLALDERERLQDGVVHARGHLGPLLRADPGRALGVALGREPPGPGAEHEQERDRDAARLEHGVALGAAGVPVDEHDHAAGHQREAHHDRAAARTADEHDAEPAEAAGQTQRVGEAEPADGERGGERQHDESDQAPTGRRCRARPRVRWRARRRA